MGETAEDRSGGVTGAASRDAREAVRRMGSGRARVWLANLALLISALPAAAQSDDLWRARGPGGGTVIALAMAPSSGGEAGTVYAGTHGDGVWRSDDGGATWRDASSGLVDPGGGALLPYVTDLDVDPRFPEVVLAATVVGVFRSLDSGAHWFPAGGPVLALLARSPTAAEVIWATDRDAVWRSQDGGLNWQRTAALPELYFVHDLAAHPADPAVAWVGTNGGVLRTVDGGAHWELLVAGMAEDPRTIFVTAVAVDPSAHATVFAANIGDGATTIFRSTDGGASWHAAFELPIPALHADVVALAVAPPLGGGPSRVLAAVNRYGTSMRGELWRSEDGGTTWDRPLVTAELQALLAAEDDQVLLGTTAAGVRASDDGGDTFAGPNTGLFALGVSALAVDPKTGTWLAAPTTPWLGPRGAGLRRSTDRGLTWRPSGEGLARRDGGPLLTALAHHPQRSSHVLAGGSAGVAQSRDGGKSWDLVYAAGDIGDVLIDPTGTMWAVGHEWVWCGIPFCGLIPVPLAVLSRDGGASWQQVMGGFDAPAAAPWQRIGELRAIAHDPLARRWYTVGTRGLFVRTAPERPWRLLGTALHTAVDLLVAPWPPRGGSSRPLPLYAALGVGNGPRIQVSRDGGVTFVPAADGLPDNTFVHRLAAHPTLRGTLFAATSRGVFVSRNAGESWQRVGGGLEQQDVLSLAIASGAGPRAPVTLLAGTARGPGLFVLTYP